MANAETLDSWPKLVVDGFEVVVVDGFEVVVVDGVLVVVVDGFTVVDGVLVVDVGDPSACPAPAQDTTRPKAAMPPTKMRKPRACRRFPPILCPRPHERPEAHCGQE